MTKKERWLLFVLASVQFTNIVDFMIMMPLGDIFQKVLEVSPFEYSILVGAYPVAAFLSSLFGVFFLDRFDRRNALLVAYSGFVIGTFSSAFVPNTDTASLNYFLFISTRVLTGLFGGILGSTVLSIVGDVIPLERRGKAMGVVMTAFSVASILGVPLSLELVNRFDQNWHVPFIMVGCLGLIILLVAFFQIPKVRGHLKDSMEKKDPFETIRIAFKSRNQQQALLFMILLVFGQFTVISFITPYLINNVGVSQDSIPYIYLVGGFCTVISSPLIGRLVDKFGRRKVFIIMAGISIIPLLVTTHLWPLPIEVVIAFQALFFIAISGRMIPANTILTTVVRPKNRGGFMSLNASVTSLSSGAAAMLAGTLITQANPGEPLLGYNHVGYFAVFFTLMAIFLATRLKEIE